jgi:lysophospholipase L1-like esterase
MAVVVAMVVTVSAASCSSASTDTSMSGSESTVTTAPGTAGRRVDSGFRTRAGTATDRLVVVGDSITNEGRDQLLAAFVGRFEVVLEGRPGHVVSELQDAAEELAVPPPAVAIIELGTNDVSYGIDTTRSAGDLRRMVDTFAATPCVVLVTVDEGLPVSGARARASALNTAIRSIVAGDPARLRLVDMTAVVDAAEADPAFGGSFHYDGIHPRAAGQARLAAAYAATVATCGR